MGNLALFLWPGSADNLTRFGVKCREIFAKCREFFKKCRDILGGMS